MDDVISTEKVDALRSVGALRDALLAEDLGNGNVRCHICQRRCRVRKGGAGYCRTKINHEGKLYTTIYGVISSSAADPIEKKPVFHYKPGSQCFSVGTLGCNFRCIFCQNWEIAYADSVDSGTGYCRTGMTPAALAQLAKDNACEGVAWTYNEPSIWLNYTLDSAILCKEQGLYTLYVTNGYATPEHIDLIGPYLDVYRVDIKSMEDRFYKELIKVPSAKGVRDVAVLAKERWDMHIECVTNIIPGWNDTPEDLQRIARWILEDLGKETPWHITRFFPYGKLSDLPPTPPETLHAAVKIGKDVGLEFVYLGNMPTETGENTYCPKCGALAVQRSRYTTRITGLNEQGNCAVDNEDLNICV